MENSNIVYGEEAQNAAMDEMENPTVRHTPKRKYPKWMRNLVVSLGLVSGVSNDIKGQTANEDRQGFGEKSPTEVVTQPQDKPVDSKEDSSNVQLDKYTPNEPKEAENTEPEFEVHQENENKQTQATDNTQEEVKYHGSSIAGAFRGNRTGRNTTFTLGSSSASASFARRGAFERTGLGTGSRRDDGLTREERQAQFKAREEERAAERLANQMKQTSLKKADELSFQEYIALYDYYAPRDAEMAKSIKDKAQFRMQLALDYNSKVGKPLSPQDMHDYYLLTASKLFQDNKDNKIYHEFGESHDSLEASSKQAAYEALPTLKRWFTKNPSKEVSKASKPQQAKTTASQESKPQEKWYDNFIFEQGKADVSIKRWAELAANSSNEERKEARGKIPQEYQRVAGYLADFAKGQKKQGVENINWDILPAKINNLLETANKEHQTKMANRQKVRPLTANDIKRKKEKQLSFMNRARNNSLHIR